jgi:haloalkane dehalogenase
VNWDDDLRFSRRDALRLSTAAAAAGVVGAVPNLSLAQAITPGSWAARKRRVRVRDLDMAYVEAGAGNPLVFLHGNPTSSYLWRNIIPHVEHLGRCIAPDMVGMGDSEPLPDSGPGKYTFATHRDYLFEMFDAIGVRDNVAFVVHDWGSGVGFSWAQQHTDRVRGLAYMEGILRPASLPPSSEPTSGPFATFRSPDGERAVLGENVFVEQLLIGGLQYYLSEADQAEYRRPYLTAGESRRPTLEWPRQLPMGGNPPDTDALVRSYTDWLQNDATVPKLFVRAAPGAIFSNPQILEFLRSFKNQREVTVYGTHYVQETAPDAIGRALAAWLTSIS